MDLQNVLTYRVWQTLSWREHLDHLWNEIAKLHLSLSLSHTHTHTHTLSSPYYTPPSLFSLSFSPLYTPTPPTLQPLRLSPSLPSHLLSTVHRRIWSPTWWLKLGQELGPYVSLNTGISTSVKNGYIHLHGVIYTNNVHLHGVPYLP